MSNTKRGIDILTTLVERANFDQLKSELETIKNEDLKIISTSVKNIKGYIKILLDYWRW